MSRQHEDLPLSWASGTTAGSPRSADPREAAVPSATRFPAAARCERARPIPGSAARGERGESRSDRAVMTPALLAKQTIRDTLTWQDGQGGRSDDTAEVIRYRLQVFAHTPAHSSPITGPGASC